jgi:predicted DCC family thiol-disulfide oxidoreductase YuxK
MNDFTKQEGKTSKTSQSTLSISHNSHIILFDGICNFCNSSVNFVLDRDHKKKFMFGALQSEAGKKLLEEYGIPQTKNYDSVILIKNNKVYKKSAASLEIAKDLSGGWPLFYVLKIIPWFIRDVFYDLIAKNRYRLMGKRDACRMPGPGEKERFLN